VALLIIAGYVWVVWTVGWVGLCFAVLHLLVVLGCATLGKK
jgi:hypothetical protein